MGNFIGDRISGTKYTVYKVRARNSDAQAGKSGGYRLIYQIESDATVILHLIYSKTDEATIAADEIQELIEAYEKEREELKEFGVDLRSSLLSNFFLNALRHLRLEHPEIATRGGDRY